MKGIDSIQPLFRRSTLQARHCNSYSLRAHQHFVALYCMNRVFINTGSNPLREAPDSLLVQSTLQAGGDVLNMAGSAFLRSGEL